MTVIPETHSDLLTDEKKAFLILATLGSRGYPQVTPVWFNADGEFILINSAEGRVKDINMKARPKVALCISDPQNPYRYLQVRGDVVEITSAGADDHIDRLAFKYKGIKKYPYLQAGEKRVTYRIRILRVDAHG